MKVIQIVSMAPSNGDAPALYALCDDGSIWESVAGTTGWGEIQPPNRKKLETIPKNMGDVNFRTKERAANREKLAEKARIRRANAT